MMLLRPDALVFAAAAAAAALLCGSASAQNLPDCTQWKGVNLLTASPPRSQECLAVCDCTPSGVCDEGTVPAQCTVACNRPFQIDWCPYPYMVAQDVGFMTAYGRTYNLDIYSDGSTNDQPLVVTVHGGGFNSGSRTNNRWKHEAAMFVEHGFRVANIDYPLCPEYFDTRTNPTGELLAWDAAGPIEEDDWSSQCNNMASPGNRLPGEVKATMAEIASRSVRLAIQYMHTGGRAAQYHIDTSKTVCYGESAGALTCAEAWLFNTSVIAVPGQTNALVPIPELDQYNIDVAATVSGGFAAGAARNVTQDTVNAMSPDAAVWDLHGDNDVIVHLNTSLALMAIAEQFLIPHLLIVNPGAGHTTNDFATCDAVGCSPNGTIESAMFGFINFHLDIATTPTAPLPTPAPNDAPPTTPLPTLPALCDTEVEQQGTQCQQICGCGCAGGGQGPCRLVCRLPNGAQSLPWCQSETPSPSPTPSPTPSPMTGGPSGGAARQGCTDLLATNYDALVTEDDGSCVCADPGIAAPCPDPSERTDPTTTPPTPPPTLTGEGASSAGSGDDDDDGSTTAVILVIVVALLVVVAMFIGAVLYKRRQADAPAQDSHRKAPAQANPIFI